jgi:CRP-like cAMP-binding protein
MVPVETLRRYSCFAGTSQQILRDITEISNERRFREGETLFREGDPANALMILMEGTIDIVFEHGEIPKRTTVDHVAAGDMMCWSAVLEPHVLHATALARTDGRVLTIDAPKLRELCGRDDQLGHQLMSRIAGVVAHRLNAARVQLAAAG